MDYLTQICNLQIFKNNKLSHLIEYNGAQHYMCPKGRWAENFEQLQAHDKLKKVFSVNREVRVADVTAKKEYVYDLYDTSLLGMVAEEKAKYNCK